MLTELKRHVSRVQQQVDELHTQKEPIATIYILPFDSVWVTDVWLLQNTETVSNHLNTLHFWMDEQGLHVYAKTHSNTLKKRQFQDSIWVDLAIMWWNNSFSVFLKYVTSKITLKIVFQKCWPGARPEKTSEYGSGTSDKSMGPAVNHSIPHQSDAHKDTCLAVLNSYHLSHKKICCQTDNGNWNHLIFERTDLGT